MYNVTILCKIELFGFGCCYGQLLPG